MTTRWFINYGFSIGIEDVMPTFDVSQTIRGGYADCQDVLLAFRESRLQRMAGCNAEQSMENKMNGILGKLRNSVSVYLPSLLVCLYSRDAINQCCVRTFIMVAPMRYVSTHCIRWCALLVAFSRLNRAFSRAGR